MAADLNERVSQLERALTRWQVITSFALVFGILGLAAAGYSNRAQSGRITATEFVLVDEKGQITARLVNSASGGMLHLGSGNGENSVMVGSLVNEWGLAIRQGDNAPIVLSSAGANGSRQLSISSPNGGKGSVYLGYHNGGPAMVLKGAADRSHFSAFVGDHPRVELVDQDGKAALFAIPWTSGTDQIDAHKNDREAYDQFMAKGAEKLEARDQHEARK